jgi:uncharacterized protein YprB with RNaseH-like and TPR domain
MLKNTFHHIPGIGVRTEKKFWGNGIQCWSDLEKNSPVKLALDKKQVIQDSYTHLENNNPGYFATRLPSHLTWRLFPDFRRTTAYLDIETTGLDSTYNEITTIALYDGEAIKYYVNGRNLDQFQYDIQKYTMIVSYNGKSFDVPFIESYFSTRLTHAHIDLRHVLGSLGYRGGLKGCEVQLGIDRGDLKDIDGFFAVLLWNEYRKNQNEKALETLLAYNIEDVVNLEVLMIMAYNMKLKETPFLATHRLPPPLSPDIPFDVDADTVEKIRRKNGYGFSSRW